MVYITTYVHAYSEQSFKTVQHGLEVSPGTGSRVRITGSRGLGSEYKRITIHLSSAIDPVTFAIAKDRNGVEG